MPTIKEKKAFAKRLMALIHEEVRKIEATEGKIQLPPHCQIQDVISTPWWMDDPNEILI